jgi:hypothetical protein
MKVTLSAAMRARDVSRPRPEDEEAAREAAAAPPPGNARARVDRADSRDRTGTDKGAGGRRRRRR